MTPLALLTYPNIDPIAIEYGPISIKWYGIAYLAGLVLGWLYIRRLISTPRLWFADKPPMTLERVDGVTLQFVAPSVEAAVRVLNCLSAMSFMLR